MAAVATLFDEEFLKKLEYLKLISNRMLPGHMRGEHRARKKGTGVEFADYRPYMPGDDLRYIDWKVVARAERWMIKQFEEETNTRAALVLDVSRSMDWSGSPARLSKLRYAEQIVAAIALLLIRQRDAVALIRYDDQLRTVLPPRARSIQWRRIVRALLEPGAGPDSLMADAVRQAAKLIRRPGLVILISDLLAPLEGLRTRLSYLRSRGHEVMIFHTLDPAEMSLNFSDPALFFDAETGKELYVDPVLIRQNYGEKLHAHVAAVESTCEALGIEYHRFTTDQPLELALFDFLTARMGAKRTVMRRGGTGAALAGGAA